MSSISRYAPGNRGLPLVTRRLTVTNSHARPRPPLPLYVISRASAFVVARSNGKRKGRSSLTITSLSFLPFRYDYLLLRRRPRLRVRTQRTGVYVSGGKSGERAIRDDNTERFNRRRQALMGYVKTEYN